MNLTSSCYLVHVHRDSNLLELQLELPALRQNTIGSESGEVH